MADLSDIVSPTVSAIYAARAREAARAPRFESWGISASALGHACERKLWYDLRWATAAEPPDGLRLRLFERGDIEERRIVEDLRRAGLTVEDLDPATGRQWRFALARGFLRGKADGQCRGVIEAPKANHVLEIKSMKAADWRAVAKHGLLAKKPEHWHQLHAGMMGLGIARGLYVGVNKDTEAILIERIRHDAEEAGRQIARVERLVDAHAAPTRLKDKPDAVPCRFCPHLGVCHQGAFARRTCRSCLHFTFTADGAGHCTRFETPQSPKAQAAGHDCPAHLYLPALVPGEQIDANPEEEWVEYRLGNGTTWRDGARTEAAA
ncbi:MAG: oxidoreductase [Pseudomonadota bacterium]